MSSAIFQQPTTIFDDPTFAPLPGEWSGYLFENFYREHTSKAPIPNSSQSAAELFANIWRRFVQMIETKRLETFLFMDDLVQADKQRSVKDLSLSPAWVKEQLSISAQTLSVWNQKAKIRSLGWGHPEPQSVAAVLIAKSMYDGDRKREYVPPAVIADRPNPWWWCWSQASPTDPPRPCPYPIPINLPSYTLLWSRWPGAYWDESDPSWLPVGLLGAIRFAGHVEQKDLERWDPDAKFRRQLVGPDFTSMLEQTLTSLAISRLGHPRVAKEA